jgi:hypothetical protein
MKEKRKTVSLSFLGELRSLYFSKLNIALNQIDSMEDEYELASWRRVLITLFIGTLAMVIATQLVRIGVFIVIVRQGDPNGMLPKLIISSELSNRLWEFGTGFAITLILALVTGYVARLWFSSGKKDIDYPLVSYVQIVVHIKTLQFIFATPLLQINSVYWNWVSYQYAISISSFISLTLWIIGGVILLYLYYILSRALQLQTELQSGVLGLQFLLVVAWCEGLAYVLTTWIAPIILTPLYQQLFQ